jgi:lipopolysaccharide transport protein LptA
MQPKMASPYPIAACLVLALYAAFTPVSAQVDSQRLPVDIDAENLEYIGDSQLVEFTGLKLTQGGISITADIGRATSTNFDDSTWDFSGNVIFDVDQGHIECSTANMQFTDFQLQVATIEGSPATFRFRRPGAEESTYAEARRLQYDVVKGVIEFTGNAIINEGGNRITSETLVYNVRDRRISAISSDDPDDRVKVTYTPPPSGESGSPGPAPERATGEDTATGDEDGDGAE